MIDWFPVEPLFNEFVEQHGGQLCSKLMTDQTAHKNADYWFSSDEVIIELKCLEKDSFNSDSDWSRWTSLIDKWVANGDINGSKLIQYTLGEAPLPEVCAKELQKLVRRSLEHTIRDARDQIKATKRWLQQPDSSGVILLVNDGNYFFQHQIFLAHISDILARRFSNRGIDGIQGLIYTTINMPASLPDDKFERLIWTPMYDYHVPDSLINFVDRLGGQWLKFYQYHAGQEHVEPIVMPTSQATNLLSKLDLLREYRDKSPHKNK